MSNTFLETDYAKAILNTYRQVDDASQIQSLPNRRSLKEKYQALESEFTQLKEQYVMLQKELIEKDQHMKQLQDDFENVIYQLTKKI